MIRCAVIDDEPLARECIATYIAKVDFLQLSMIGASPMELPKTSAHSTIDLLFLDIQMPIINGIDYLKATKHRPLVILTTAHPHYALEGYELDVLDYLLKPITFNRFYQAALKAHDYCQLRDGTANLVNTTSAPEYFFVKCNQIYEKIFFSEVLYVEAQENYVAIFTAENKYMVLMPIKRIQELLGSPFIRVHKSYIVAVDKITSVEKHRLTIASHTIPVSRNYWNNVLEYVVEKKLWKK